MADYQFYQLQSDGRPEAPSIAPSPKRDYGKLLVVLGLLGVVAVVVTIVVFASGRDRVVTEVDSRIAECTASGKVVEECFVAVSTDIAKSEGDAGVCRSLSGSERENCVTVVAVREADDKACRQLSGDEVRRCRDRVFYERAMAERDVAFCEMINGDEVKAPCLQRFNTPSDALLRALEDFQPEYCETLTNAEEKKTCEELFETSDRDNDGFTDYEEVQNGFNPQE